MALMLPLVVVLSLPLAFADALPLFAKMVAGPDAHVCECSLHHSECACPICHPDRTDFELSEEAIHGKCGSDSVMHGGKLGIAITPPAALLTFALTDVTPVAHDPPRAPDELFATPPVPPPRHASV